jgi:hypothetical protein
MGNVPTIGGTRGIFGLLVPGVFMVMNLVAVVYWLPFTDNETKQLIAIGASNQVLSSLLAIIFGYLMGITLRLFRTEIADKLSAKWLQIFSREARNKDGTLKLYATEEFPYIGWIGERFRQTLPPETLDFYDKVWAPRKIKGRNRQFFNFCKAMIVSMEGKYADEVHAAEALSRYVAGMLYALMCVFSLMLVTAILRYIVLGEILTALASILLVYLAAIVSILANFRFVRMKEVETVFAASFKYQILLEEDRKKAQSKPVDSLLMKLKQWRE